MSAIDLTGQNSKYRTIDEIMNVPALKAVLSSYVDEAVKCKQEIQKQQELLKGHRETACEELGIKPIMFNQFVDMVFKNDYAARLDKFSELTNLVETVMQASNMSLARPVGDDD